MWKKLLLALTLAFAPLAAHAQGGALVASSPTPAVGHCAQWATNNSLTDSGNTCGGGGGGGSGTVTSITAGTNLTGGTITTAGTIGLGSNVPLKASANTFSQPQSIISSGLAGSAAAALTLTPSDYGTGKPGLFVTLGSCATCWNLYTSDNITTAGTISVTSTNFLFNGSQVLTAGASGFATLAGANIFTNNNTIKAGTATSNTGFLGLVPTNYGVGKPALTFQKDATATSWTMGLFDGSTYNGTINISAQNVNIPGNVGITGNLTVSSCTGCGGGGGGGGYATVYDVVGTYGGDPSGSGDNVTPFNNALSACASSGGGIIWFRAGTFKFNSGISLSSNGCSIVGAGLNATNFVFYGSGNFISTSATGTNLRDFKITQSGGMSSGYAIAWASGFSVAQNLYITGTYAGIAVTANGGNFDQIQIDSLTGGASINCDGSGSGGVFGARFTHVNGNQPSGSINQIHQGGNCNTLVLEQVSFQGGAYCYYGDGSWLGLVAVDLECDHSNYGIAFAGGSDVQITSSWFGSALAGNGLSFLSGFGGDAVITNTIIRCNYQHGVLINSGDDVTISNSAIGCNSQGGAGSFNGITVGANVNKFTLVGNRIGDVWPQGPSQGYCVLVSTGSSDHYIISNNNCAGQTIGAVADGGSGSNKYVVGNIQ